METPERLGYFISRVASDERLKPTHISLYVGLCHVWITSRYQRCYNVSRRQLMRLSRIQSKSTYHKTISELASMGYIHYRPSYHPIQGSRVSLFKLVESRYSHQHTQAGPDPVFGLALGLRAQDPALNGYAGPAGPGGRCVNALCHLANS